MLIMLNESPTPIDNALSRHIKPIPTRAKHPATKALFSGFLLKIIQLIKGTNATYAVHKND